MAFIADLIEKERHPNTDAWVRLSDSTLALTHNPLQSCVLDLIGSNSFIDFEFISLGSHPDCVVIPRLTTALV